MVKMTYFDGQFFSEEEFFLKTTNRAFRYGDSVFESIVFFRGHAPFLRQHFERLKLACNYSGIILPKYFTLKFLANTLTILVGCLQTDNKLPTTTKPNARIRISVWRSDGGLYTPSNNAAQFFIEAECLPNSSFIVPSSNGICLGICPYPQPAEHIFGGFKTGSALAYVRAALYKQAQGWDDCILITRNGQWLETTAYNLFVLTKKLQLLTPPENCCVKGIMRQQLLLWANEIGLRVSEQPIYLGKDNLITENISEIWCCNAVQGVRWVTEWEGKKLDHEWAAKVVIHLNKLVAIDELKNIDM